MSVRIPLACVLALLAFACLHRAPETGFVRVEVFRTLRPIPDPAALPTPEVYVLLDLTPSMRAGPDAPLEQSRSGAARLLRSLPPDVATEVHAYGHLPGLDERCGASGPLGRAATPAEREPLLAALAEARPVVEASAAAALDELRARLEATGRARRARVVWFSDLAPDCDADLCRAARGLVDAGAWVEAVVPRGVEVPACLAELRPSLATPGPVVSALTPPEVPFWIEAGLRPEAAGVALARGYSGGPAVEVAAGDRVLVVDLGLPQRLGPFRVEAGRVTRVRVVEAAAAGAVPTWQAEVEP